MISLLSLTLLSSLYFFIPNANTVNDNYVKTEHQIQMRDGKKLFTVVYSPKDTTKKYPIMMNRTPYGSGPYGSGVKNNLGPSPKFMQDGYIFVYQDVRGTFMSEGEFDDVRPYNPNKKSKNDVDESSDTYDTIDWLVKNIPNNNGHVGVWGISYPGFYASMSLIDSHPALKAVSPQAPIADWFLGDDDHHNGALFIYDAFTFSYGFGMPRPKPTTNQFNDFSIPSNNAYDFFLGLGSVANAQTKYFKGQKPYWNDLNQHINYDDFWKVRNVPQHLTNTRPAVLVVGGWFDAEDLYGALKTYEAIEKQNASTYNVLVMGPWYHGQWARGSGESLHDIKFGSDTSQYYRDEIEHPFFKYHLKNEGELKLPEASVFVTGSNQWKSFNEWPAKNVQQQSLYFHPNQSLSFNVPSDSKESFDEYVSDPASPVPYSQTMTNDRGRKYMIEDQRFVSSRKDVLSYQTEPLTQDTTLAGPVIADLFTSITGTDADFVVKIIDVHPENSSLPGYQMLVRAEVMRGKFRNSMSSPEPFVPNKTTEVKVNLNDLLHTFKAGHRIMIQVQSSWFPLVDRNPQTFTDIYNAKESDFQKATHRIHHSANAPSHVKVGILK